MNIQCLSCRGRCRTYCSKPNW